METGIGARRGKNGRMGIRILAFWMIFLLLFLGAWRIFGHPADYRTFWSIGGFYEEPEDTLHGVYFGSSNCYAFWNPLVAWKNYGLAIHSYASANQSLHAVEYLIKDARKAQPDALFIVNVNSADQEDLGAAMTHTLLGFMPWSRNKVDMINRLCDIMGYSQDERWEFYFPWARLHGSWGSVLQYGTSLRLDGMKGSSRYPSYFGKNEDISSRYIVSDTRTGISENMIESLTRLLDYADAEDVNLLFVSVPRAEYNETTLGRINSVCDLIEGRGYPVLYLTDQADVLNLDLERDYYDLKHSNVHGSIKVTNAVCRYILENYDLQDKRGDARYASWDEAWEEYILQADDHILGFELDASCRDGSLKAPEGLQARAEADGIALQWEGAAGADGYAVYRKDGSGGAWRELAVTENNGFLDADCESGAAYCYRVVPLRKDGGRIFYGHFSYDGVEAAV